MHSNGLGYNNLLYSATVVAHLRESPVDETPILLIEEPEAHLHPQLTIQLGEYFGGKLTGAEPPQTIVTTHSPTLASKVKPSQVIVLHDATSEAGEPRTVSKALASVGLTPAEERQLERMLDITRASMYFARGETVYAWGVRMQRALVTLLTDRGWLARSPNALKPKAPFKKSTNVPRPYTARAAQATRVRLKTVHGAKGETHNITFFYIPRPRTATNCPAVAWWSEIEAVREEQRVAFVAATRPTDMFVLCVHRETYGRLLAARSEFVALFDVVDIADSSDVRSTLGLTVATM